jgi:hypothetical protein
MERSRHQDLQAMVIGKNSPQNVVYAAAPKAAVRALVILRLWQDVNRGLVDLREHGS